MLRQMSRLERHTGLSQRDADCHVKSLVAGGMAML